MNTSAVLQRADKAVGFAKRAYDLVGPGIGFLLGLNVPSKSIDARTVYSVAEAARLMKVNDPALIRELIETGRLHGRKVGEDYLVLGQSILDFFKT